MVSNIPLSSAATAMPLPLVLDRSPRPPLPMTRDEMLARGWDSVDVVFVSGDAYEIGRARV